MRLKWVLALYVGWCNGATQFPGYDPAQAARLVWPEQWAFMLEPHAGDDGTDNLIKEAYHDIVWYIMNRIIHMTPRMLPIDPLERPTKINLAYPLPLTVADEKTIRARKFQGSAIASDPAAAYNAPSVWSNLVRSSDADFDLVIHNDYWEPMRERGRAKDTGPGPIHHSNRSDRSVPILGINNWMTRFAPFMEETQGRLFNNARDKFLIGLEEKRRRLQSTEDFRHNNGRAIVELKRIRAGVTKLQNYISSSDRGTYSKEE